MRIELLVQSIVQNYGKDFGAIGIARKCDALPRLPQEGIVFDWTNRLG